MSSRLRADFQPEELAAVLTHYRIGAIQRVEKQLKGSRRSPKVIISSDRGRFLLKRRAKGRDHPIKVDSAHRVQQYLTGRQFPLPHLVAARIPAATPAAGSGEAATIDTMLMLDGQIYEMFEYVEGGHYDRSIQATADAGRVLALFHRSIAGYQLEWEPSRRGFHDNQAVRTNLNSIPASIGKDDSVAGKESELLSTVTTLYDSYETATEFVNEAGYYDWPAQLVHSDWHPGNMLFQNKAVVAVIDYDSLHLLPPITDLANGALQFSILGGPIDPRQWPAELDEERFKAFISGYDRGVRSADGEADVEEPHDGRRGSATRGPSQPGQERDVLPQLMIEALIAEAVLPIAATGSFGRMEGFRFLQMVARKVHWLENNGDRLLNLLRS